VSRALAVSSDGNQSPSACASVDPSLVSRMSHPP
jgi:hypothetical protein